MNAKFLTRAIGPLLRWLLGDNNPGRVVRITTIESAVNQLIDKRMSKSQQMRWSQKGAHALLQVRAELVDGRLPMNFARWYPGMAVEN